MHDEHSSEGQQPEPWTIWSAQSEQPGQPASAQPSSGQPESGGQPGSNPGQASDAVIPPPPPPPPPGFGQADQPGSYTQPIGYGQPSGYGQPGGYTQPLGYAQPGGYGQAPGYPQPSPRRRRITSAITYIAVAAVAATAGGVTVYAVNHGSTPAASSSPNSGTGNGTGNGNANPFGNPNGGQPGGNASGNPNISGATVHKVQNAIIPGLVVISSNLQYQGDAAEATGMVISSNGLVLTNNHVIDSTTALTATVVSTGQKFTAHWLGYDKSADIAVIQLVGASGLRTVPLGSSATVKKGDGVVAMGNANGTGTITTVTGTITGLDKSITASDGGTGDSEQLTDMIQTDSRIIPGDSGGPLANLSGKVIAMDTAASTNAFGSAAPQNVGFAIPIDRAMTIARQIINGQSSSAVRIGSAGFLGVLVTGGKNNQQSTLTSPSAQLRQTIKNDQSNGFSGTPGGPRSNACVTSNTAADVPSKIAPVGSGTLVLGALCGTPANTVGLVPGDVITRLDGRGVTSPASMVAILAALKSGQVVPVTWVTPNDQKVSRTMTLAAAPPT